MERKDSDADSHARHQERGSQRLPVLDLVISGVMTNLWKPNTHLLASLTIKPTILFPVELIFKVKDKVSMNFVTFPTTHHTLPCCVLPLRKGFRPRAGMNVMYLISLLNKRISCQDLFNGLRCNRVYRGSGLIQFSLASLIFQFLTLTSSSSPVVS